MSVIRFNDKDGIEVRDLEYYREVKAFVKNEEGRTKSYRLRVTGLKGENWEYSLRTTNKDLALGFLQTPDKELWAVARFLECALAATDEVAYERADGQVYTVTRVAHTAPQVVALFFSTGR